MLEKLLYNSLYIKYFPNYYNFLAKNLRDCSSILDLGCGNNSPLQYFPDMSSCACGLDIFHPYLEESRIKKIHKSYILANILNLGIKPKSFDCVLALDFIEHLEREEVFKLIKVMETIARKRVILFTPNGFLDQKPYDGNNYQSHKSGWACKDLESLGFMAFGFFGLKYLRGEHGKIKFRPRLLWFLVSELTQPFVFRFPKFASQIFFIKNF